MLELFLLLVVGIVVGTLVVAAYLRQRDTNTQDDLGLDEDGRVISGDYTVHKKRRRQQPLWY
jgi:hypothetical protein